MDAGRPRPGRARCSHPSPPLPPTKEIATTTRTAASLLTRPLQPQEANNPHVTNTERRLFVITRPKRSEAQAEGSAFPLAVRRPRDRLGQPRTLCVPARAYKLSTTLAS